MDDQTHTELLKLQSREVVGRTPFCPDDQQIAEYFDGDLADHDRDSLQRHLADCRFCLSRIGVLQRLQEGGPVHRVSEDVLATAKQLQQRPPSRRPLRAPAWAVAAVVVLAMAIFFDWNQGRVPRPGSSSPTADSTAGEPGQLRSINPDPTYLEVLTPPPGTDIAPGGQIRWGAVPGSLYYKINILSLAGNVLWTEQLGSNEWLMQDTHQLAPGSEFYVRVEARLPDGSTVSSKHWLFRSADQ
jgi:hypothetical protein